MGQWKALQTGHLSSFCCELWFLRVERSVSKSPWVALEALLAPGLAIAIAGPLPPAEGGKLCF